MNGKYRWKIVKDHIGGGSEGTEGPANAPDEDLLDEPNYEEEDFRLLDDDEIVYYTGRIWGDYDGFEPLDEFGSPNAGAVAIQYKDDKGEWGYL